MNHFVYLYRDSQRRPIYIGRGGKTARSLIHASNRGHKVDLTAALEKSPRYTIEIAGPFDSEETASLIEAALLSVLLDAPDSLLKNKIGGVSSGVFRPIGVPPKFGERSGLAPLTKKDFKQIAGGQPCLFVFIGDKTLGTRIGVDLANPPSELAIQERMVKWWQLNSKMDSWTADRESIPGIPIAVSGPPKHRVIIGSLQIDRDPSRVPWPSKSGGISEVPVLSDPELDYKDIRGRRVAHDVTEFGGIRAMFFNIL